ncbi:MAG: uroporphyrinogen decarboxylase [Chloroflexi bacterium]|nr:uroporphyrinogen decarboxylase [Chloroflexota bacterium]
MIKRWTSRERVEAALNHRESDRVPIDFCITLNAYIRLREYLGLPAESNVQHDRFFEVRPPLDMIERLGLDMTFVRLRKPANWKSPPPLADGTQLDEWGVGRKLVDLPDGAHLFEVTYSPWKNLEPADIDLDAFAWPDPHAPGIANGLEQEARQLAEGAGLALMGRFGGPMLEIGGYLRGFEQWLMDLVLHPDFSREVLERIADIQIALDEQGIKAVGPYLSIFKASGEDLGMQDRPLFSMKVWKQVLFPPLERRWRAARAALDRYAPHVKVMLHSDGAIRPFLPDIIACGIEVIDPVQGVCAGMELDGLKRDFGGQLSFHGGVDTQFVLPHKSVPEVIAETSRVIQALGRGGGLVLGPSHFLQSDVPPENILAMCQTAHKQGVYPLRERLVPLA